MNHVNYHEAHLSLQDGFDLNKKAGFWANYTFPLIVVLALVVDVFTPYLIWKGYVPGALRWVADACIALLLLISITRMLAFDNIPRAALLILGITIIWSAIAIFEGQSALATSWGWWRLFKYPMVGLFLYLQPHWPERFSQRFFDICFKLLIFEIIFQLIQYATGEVPGDNLAGSFGRHGVAPLFFFISFVLSMALGKWLTFGDSKTLIWVILLGSIASGLGEMKVFPVALVFLGLLSLVIHMIRGGRIREMLLYIVLFVIVVPSFIAFYNVVVADARGTRRFEEYFVADTTEQYLNNVDYDSTTGQTYLGRGFALSYGWDIIHRDITTLLFGYGIGARGESVSLGIVGSGLSEGDYGLVTGTSLLVLMQELGLVGLGVLGSVFAWIIFALFRHIRQDPQSYLTVLRYGIILFTFMWPVWIWYHKVWGFSVAMILYWGIVGYLFRHSPEQEQKSFINKVSI